MKLPDINCCESNKSSEKDILLLEHDNEEAEQLCERIGVVHKGRMVALDKTKDLIKRLSAKGIGILVKEPLTKIPAPLKKFRVKREGEHCLQFNEDTDKLNAILKAVYKAKLHVINIEAQQEKLEQIFMRLTQ